MHNIRKTNTNINGDAKMNLGGSGFHPSFTALTK